MVSARERESLALVLALVRSAVRFAAGLIDGEECPRSARTRRVQRQLKQLGLVIDAVEALERERR